MKTAVWIALVSGILLDRSENRSDGEDRYTFVSGATGQEVLFSERGGCDIKEGDFKDDSVAEIRSGQEWEFDSALGSVRWAIDQGLIVKASTMVPDIPIRMDFNINQKFQPVLDPLINLIVNFVVNNKWVMKYDFLVAIIRLFAARNFMIEYIDEIETGVKAEL